LAWTLGGVTIHPDDGEFSGRVESNYAIQRVLDAVVNTISYYGANSELVQLAFILDENVNSNTGLSTLKTAAKANSNVALVGDTGSLGNWRILSFTYRRRQALAHTNPVYSCSAELISV